MFTPQQLQQITFDKAVFGGYDMESVDEVLEPLMEDYEALYRENHTLKSKMRVLVEKLEEYRANEGSVKEALRSAQRTCDSMIRDAEKKCLDMLRTAKAQSGVEPAAAEAPAADDHQVKELQSAALETAEKLEAQLHAMEQIIDQMKQQVQCAAQPAQPAGADEADVAREIAENLERIVGTTEDEAPVTPRAATHSATSRFSNMDLKFGRNYDPTKP